MYMVCTATYRNLFPWVCPVAGGFHNVLGLQHQRLGHGLTQRRRGAARLWRLGLVEALGGDGGRDAATSRGGWMGWWDHN